MDQKMETYLFQLEKKHSLTGLLKQIFRVLIQEELNLNAGTTLGTHKALMNFKKKSPIRQAYEEFQKDRTGKVPWRSPKES